MKYRVSYQILTEARTDSNPGCSRTDLSGLSMIVEASGPSAACSIVETMFGGYSRCRTFVAVPV